MIINHSKFSGERLRDHEKDRAEDDGNRPFPHQYNSAACVRSFTGEFSDLGLRRRGRGDLPGDLIALIESAYLAASCARRSE